MSYRVAHSLQQCALGTCQERREWRPQKWENALYEGSYEGRLTKGCVAVPAVSRGGRAPAPAPGNSRLACAQEGEQRHVDLLGPLLLGPVPAPLQQEPVLEVRGEGAQVGERVVPAVAHAREGVLLPPGARRRAAAFHASRFAFPGLRLTHASPIDPSLLK